MHGPVLQNEYWSDMRIYLNISAAIESGIWKESHFFQSIGYPWIISMIRKFSGHYGEILTVFQTMASSLTLAFFYLMVRDGLGRKVALISLFIGALHVPWIFFITFALPEVLFTFLLSICGYLSVKIVHSKKHPLLFSLLWGTAFILAFWLKGTHALWGPLFLSGLLLLKRKASIVPIILISTVVGGGLLAHGYLTHNLFGKIQFGPSTGGLNFVEGKCPSKVNMDSEGFHWQSPLYYQLEKNALKKWNKPFTHSGYFYKQGLKCIQNNPLVLLQSLESIPFLFYGNTIWPFNRKPLSDLSRLYELFFTIFVIVGLVAFLFMSLSFQNLQNVVIWVFPVLAIFLCVYIFKSEMRYRIPYDLWFIPIAVKGWLDFAALRKVRIRP